MRLLWEEEAWEDYCLWQTRDKKLLKRINALLKDIQRNTYEGIGKPEPLKGDLSGWGGAAESTTRTESFIRSRTEISSSRPASDIMMTPEKRGQLPCGSRPLFLFKP